MRLILWLVAGVWTAAMAGCCCMSKAPSEFGPPAESLVQSPQAPEFAAGLIFDRRPGYFRATDFASRSSWPSTDSFYSPSQVIEFREHFVDYQGRPFSDWDYSYRRFDTRRTGVAFR